MQLKKEISKILNKSGAYQQLAKLAEQNGCKTDDIELLAWQLENFIADKLSHTYKKN